MTSHCECDGCRKDASGYGSVQVSDGADSRNLCNRCFNEEAARRLGLEGVFRYLGFEPVVLLSAKGELHEFHFHTHLYGAGVLLEAAELKKRVPRGYRFAVSGEPDGDPSDLHERLLDKIRLGLSRTHIVEDENGLSLGSGDRLRGWIEWDDQTQGEFPLLSVDGRPLTWDELGRILMAYEGFQLKLEIRDKAEEI